MKDIPRKYLKFKKPRMVMLKSLPYYIKGKT